MFSRRIYVWKVCLKNYSSIWSWQKKKNKKKNKKPVGLCSQGSDQFMNWIEIDNQFNSIQHELNWNWIERFWIGIELELKAWTDRNWSIQPIHFQFNSSFYMVKHFFICHIMEIVVWQAIPCKQAYPHAPLCVPSMGSAGVFGHKGITITSITLKYFQCFNSLVMKSFFVTQKDHQLISPL